MAEPHDWPLEQSARGTLRPFLSDVVGYLLVLFSDPEEAQREPAGQLHPPAPRRRVVVTRMVWVREAGASSRPRLVIWSLRSPGVARLGGLWSRQMATQQQPACSKAKREGPNPCPF